MSRFHFVEFGHAIRVVQQICCAHVERAPSPQTVRQCEALSHVESGIES